MTLRHLKVELVLMLTSVGTCHTLHQPVNGMTDLRNVGRDESINDSQVLHDPGGCAGPDSFQFDEAFGHKSCFKAVKETVTVWLTGLFLLLVVRVPFLITWIKGNSLKPGEGKMHSNRVFPDISRQCILHADYMIRKILNRVQATLAG